MRNINSLKNKEFSCVYNEGKSYANKYLVMYVSEDENISVKEDIRLGISISKRVGNSVVRHRLTRLVRESFRLNRSLLNSGLSIVVVGRPAMKDKGYKEIESAFLHLAKLHGILKSKIKTCDTVRKS